MRRRLLLLAAGGALVVASSALAGGGTSIANAPELPLFGDVVGGTSNIEGAHVCGAAGDATEFYRVSLGAGDVLTLDYWGTLPDEIVGIGILSPSVTDSTLDQANCVLSQSAGSGRVAFNAPYAGSWIMAVRAATTLGYRLEPNVQKYTRAALTGPKVVKRGSLVILGGGIHGVMNSNAGASARRATMQLWKHSRWKTLGAVLLGPAGRFEYFWRAQQVGVARLRVVYFGGAHYLPSRATHSVRVTAK